MPLEYQGAPVPVKMNKLGSGGSPGSGSFLFADPLAENRSNAEVAHASKQRALAALRDRQDDTATNGSSNSNSNGGGRKR